MLYINSNEIKGISVCFMCISSLFQESSGISVKSCDCYMSFFKSLNFTDFYTCYGVLFGCKFCPSFSVSLLQVLRSAIQDHQEEQILSFLSRPLFRRCFMCRKANRKSTKCQPCKTFWKVYLVLCSR